MTFPENDKGKKKKNHHQDCFCGKSEIQQGTCSSREENLYVNNHHQSNGMSTTTPVDEFNSCFYVKITGLRFCIKPASRTVGKPPRSNNQS